MSAASSAPGGAEVPDGAEVPLRIFVLRHGRTLWNAQRRFQGQADPPLDDVGLTQARAAAALLATFAPDLIVTSDLLRASQTAAALERATGLGAIADRRLRERSLGHWEGLTREEVETSYPDEFADWLAGRDVSRRGGESREQVAQRSREMLDGLPALRTVVLVTHSATAMALSGVVLNLPPERHILGPLANCHWSELQREGGSWRLRAHNAGAPGGIVPLLAPGASDDGADSPDAEAMDAAAR